MEQNGKSETVPDIYGPLLSEMQIGLKKNDNFQEWQMKTEFTNTDF